MMMGLEEFTAQSDVIDLGGVTAKVTWEVQRQVMDRVESDDP